MKGSHKRSILGVLCALLLGILLFVPTEVEAAELTVTSTSRKDYTAVANGETIYVTLSGATTNTNMMGKPSWITVIGSSSSYKLVVAKNTAKSARSGDVVFRAGNKVFTVRITQKGAPTTVTVKFNNNGGSGKVPNSTYTIGKAYGKLPAGSTPSTGKKFAGWYTKPSGGTKVTTKTKASASVTVLYAHYTNKSYTVKFDSQGGSAVASKNVTYGANYGTLKTPKRTGYNFAGWYTAASGGKKVTSSTKMATAVGHTLYAHWTAQTFTITFDSQGGSAVSSRNVAYNGTYGELRTPTRDGYTFLGWFTAKSGGTQITSASKLTQAAKQTLYAHWKGTPITVKFDKNGGNGDVPNQSYTVDAKYGKLPAGTTGPKGYKFDGWYTARTGGTKITENSIVSAANKTLYAQYKPMTVTLSFNSVGGSAVSSRNVTYDSKYGNLPVPKKYGYLFEGWFTKEKGGDEITKDSIVSFASNHTLYAHWKYNMVSVHFDSNGGKGNVPNKSYEIGSKYGSLPAGSNAPAVNLKFDGWYTAKNDGTKITADTIASASYTTLYAHYVYDPKAFFYANNRFKAASKAKTIPYNSGIEESKKIGTKEYEYIYKTRNANYNKKNLPFDEYIKDIRSRAAVLQVIGVGGSILQVTPTANLLLQHYFNGKGKFYEYDATPYVLNNSIGSPEYIKTATLLMRQMEKYLIKGEKITFVDRDSHSNPLEYTMKSKYDITAVNAYVGVKGCSTGVSGSCTFDGTKYKMDLYFYVQDYYDFYYSDTDKNSQSNCPMFTVCNDELAFLFLAGKAKPYESCGVFHTVIEWKEGEPIKLVGTGLIDNSILEYPGYAKVKWKSK